MKKRIGFVSNSSSSSFVLAKRYLTEGQIVMIKNHVEEGKRLGIPWAEDGWTIHENDNFVSGHTWMDNFDMHEFFKKIGIDPDLAKWGDGYIDESDYQDDYDEEGGESSWAFHYVWKCNHCKEEWMMNKPMAKFCPFCGSVDIEDVV